MTINMRSALLIGTGGFGNVHLRELTRLEDEGVLRLAAASDVRVPEQSAKLIADRGLRVYSDYREMLAAETGADFVIVSTPIQLHAPMCCDAMEAGYHVLLEKPPGATIQDVDAIAETARRTGKLCAVNFFAPSRSALERIVTIAASGDVGRIHSIKGLSLLTRTHAYFNRTPWAGKLRANGAVVLDGAFHNPAAHLLYSMLKLAELVSGPDGTGSGADPLRVAAEMYHANAIESDDTTSMRIELRDGTTLCFYVTLCARRAETQRIRLEGTEGAIEWDYQDQVTVWSKGETRSFDCGEGSVLERRYRNLMRAIEGVDDRLDVSIESARRFTLAANGAFESAGRIRTVPPAFVVRSTDADQPGSYIEGIEATLKEAFAAGKLLSETGAPWAEPSTPFDVSDYRHFPQRFRFSE
ncbi:Gfo/Idh/MocA family oxidoreductase [Paenibacillus antri]|uniref:Gfo/Idh/MocA family oxidoreductase n=1 Tax=Paenibacillus antri TaxID=2582848 RepID=A0A5R9GEB3_9BACL|nr:Gfo/Idh/MocA family oxidoreductase [Paenibacillus antri]TLS52686.1 Gfo/Idh/MocA family oxidoreductase [Paenibacillus antri]